MSSFGKREGVGRRSTARAAPPLSGLLTTLHGTRLAVVIDVSATGAQVRGEDLPPKWTDLFINLEGVVAFATVRWADGDRRGIEFDAPLHPDDEQLLHQMLCEAKGVWPAMRGTKEWALSASCGPALGARRATGG